MEVFVDRLARPPLDGMEEFEMTPVPFSLLGRDTTYMAEGSRFEHSTLGRSFNSELRFAHFKYDPDRMVADLGLDATPQGHNRLAYVYAANVASQQRAAGKLVDQREEAIALLSQRIHDIGEVISPELAAIIGRSVGDIRFGEKTAEDRAIEALTRKMLYARFYNDYPLDVLDRLEGVISHTDCDSQAHDIAECGHALLTYSTGLRALTIVLSEKDLEDDLPSDMQRPTHEISQLSALGLEVVGNMKPLLVGFADMGYVAAQRALEATEKLYTRAQSELRSDNVV